MTLTPANLVPAVVVSLLVFRRIRRSIGRQPLQPRRMTVRIVIFSVLTLVLAALALDHLPALLGLAGGLVAGVPVGMIGLHFTRFETVAEKRYYIPNPYFGAALSILFIGRMAYRMMAGPAAASQPPDFAQSPLTLFLFGVLAGYYLVYFTGILVRSHAAPESSEAAEPPILNR